MPQQFSSPRTSSTSVTAWLGAAGRYEEYAYAPGRRGRDERHVHGDVQICLSLNFPGRYRTTRSAIDVPAGAISIVDAWEPHAAEDPCDRTSVARYWMLCVSRLTRHFAKYLGITPGRYRPLARVEPGGQWRRRMRG